MQTNIKLLTMKKKNLLLIIILFCLGQVNAQCVKLYVKEYLGDSPICNLSTGDFIEICEDMNEVYGCPRDFYIYKKGFSSGSLTYELSLDQGWSTHYMTLMVNPSTKRFGFILQGQTALYTYYSEAEMAAAQAQEDERKRLANQRQAEEAAKQEKKNAELLLLDSKKYNSINLLLDKGKLEDAYREYKTLNIPNKYDRERELLEKRKLENNKLAQQKIIKGLDSLITLNDFLGAADIYFLNHEAYSISSYYDKIRNGLISLYSKDTMILNDGVSNTFITSNSENLKKLKAGNYSYYFDENGNSTNGDLKLDPKQIPSKKIGNNQLKIGDRYLGGIVISINDKEIVVSSLTPIGAGIYSHALVECEKHQINGMSCRLPTADELMSIFKLKNKLDSYENNWYWTSNENGSVAEHIGLYYGDRAFVPKEHGKWFFAVRTISVYSVDIPLTSKINLKVVENKDVVINTKYSSSSTKPILLTQDEQFCYKTEKEFVIIPFTADKSIVKNMIRVEQSLETIKTINEIKVMQESKKTVNEFLINKKL